MVPCDTILSVFFGATGAPAGPWWYFLGWWDVVFPKYLVPLGGGRVLCPRELRANLDQVLSVVGSLHLCHPTMLGGGCESQAWRELEHFPGQVLFCSEIPPWQCLLVRRESSSPGRSSWQGSQSDPLLVPWASCVAGRTLVQSRGSSASPAASWPGNILHVSPWVIHGTQPGSFPCLISLSFITGWPDVQHLEDFCFTYFS